VWVNGNKVHAISSTWSALVLIAVIAAVTVLTATGHFTGQLAAATLGVVLGHLGTVSSIGSVVQAQQAAVQAPRGAVDSE